jgi:hypothetical protein
MKVLFAGPSLYGHAPDLSDIVSRGPAAQGDIAQAVLSGATAIGLVDGNFDSVAAPWHKEILFALSKGVAVLGSSSMGALRAAECASFGMRPIGQIAEAYCSGVLDDDAAVALSHGPMELGYPPLTEPLVDVEPTLAKLYRLRLLSKDERGEAWREARRLYFKDRSDRAIFARLPGKLAAYREHRVNLKGEDALLLVSELKKCPMHLAPAHPRQEPSFFSRQVLPGLTPFGSSRPT